MWSLTPVLATALLSLLLWDFAVVQAVVYGGPEREALKLRWATLKELRNNRTGDSANRIGYVFQDLALSDRTGYSHVESQHKPEFKLRDWLDQRKCVRSSSSRRAKESALSCARNCDRMWFGWSDDTAGFLEGVTQSYSISETFPLLISLNRNGWALMSANEFSNQDSSPKCVVDPVGPWAYSKRWATVIAKEVLLYLPDNHDKFYSDVEIPKRQAKLRLTAEGVSQFLAHRHVFLRLERLQVELADWTAVERQPMGSSIDDATRAKVVASFVRSGQLRALTISWMPQPSQSKRKHAKTLGVMASALAEPTSGITYLAISDLNQKAVDPPTKERLLPAFYSAGRETAVWSTLREFSVTLKSYGLDHRSKLFDALKGLLELMPRLRHFNINVDHPIRLTLSEIRNIVGTNDGVSYSMAAQSAFIGIAPAAKLHQFDREGKAILLSLPQIDRSNRDGANGDHLCNVQHIHSSLLDTTAALTLFVKKSVCENHAVQLGRDISSGNFPMLERLAIDGWWSAVTVNDVLLRMRPQLPPTVSHALIRPVSLLSNNAKETMAVLREMLVNSDVEALALTVILPCDVLQNRRTPYADQLVDTLTGMAHLTRLSLTLSTCTDPQAAAAAETISRRVRAKLPFARVMHHSWTETWTENNCRSTEPFPAFDAFASELSDKLKAIARCTPPTLEFPMPHHFSGAFDYRTHGQVERLLDNDAPGQEADLLGDITSGPEADLLDMS